MTRYQADAILRSMGDLSRSLGRWVRAMNRNATSKADEELRDQEIHEAFDALASAYLNKSSWDDADQKAAEILNAFDRSQHGP